MGVRVGLCGWTVSQASYVRRFPVVGVQHTFYEPPSDAVLMRWRAQVPAGFEFTIKAWQVVTHESNSPTYRRMKQPLPDSARGQVGAFRTTPAVLAGWQRTLECARILQATAVLLQCPKSFRPTGDNSTLTAICDALDCRPGDILDVEVRAFSTPLIGAGSSVSCVAWHCARCSSVGPASSARRRPGGRSRRASRSPCSTAGSRRSARCPTAPA
ncbi:DUF72 domain-containing protein [Cellulomonas shaoxiangyii]|uniref:DUF72 domain-containing protein n=1 Tax=Cellulomonas shaoxiangyii TaxID=2566013 RepID=A0A4P7SP56_9CELL|nr:DUF72 domain-containing protein [Cellulomonas shaoxiangyii]TGY86484.1 DUF72 domain-containing protein [Cellulomonas shaoxiangyii]